MNVTMLADLYVESLQYRENLLARYFAKHGHQVTVIASTFETARDYYANRYDASRQSRTFHDGPIEVIKLPYSLNLLNRLRRFDGVSEILERSTPDIIFVNDIHLNLREAVQYRRRHPDSRLIFCTGMDATNSARGWLSREVLHRQIRRRLLNRWRPYIDKLYVAVPSSAAFLRSVYGIPERDMDLLPLCADTDVAADARASSSRTVIRERLGFRESDLVVFTGGKIAPLKQTHMVVEAVQRLQGSRVGLIAVGEAEEGSEGYYAELRALAADNPLIQFVGWQTGPAVYSYMSACDVAVFPASQSVLWQQALAMGLVLIVGRATWRGDQDPSYMNPYDNMIVMRREDVNGANLAASLERLSVNRAELERLQMLSLRVTDERLNYDRLVERMIRDTMGVDTGAGAGL